MEPSFKRGDLLFLTLMDEPIRIGDITVFKIAGKDIPIVHRVLELHDEYISSIFINYIVFGPENSLY